MSQGLQHLKEMMRMKMKMKFQLSTSFWLKCNHIELSQDTAILYCLILSTLFVSSLYILVPKRIRKLPRDNAKQIKWRALATSIVSLGAMVTYPILFCNWSLEYFWNWPIVSILGIDRVSGVLIHTMLLYIGPLSSSLLKVYERRKFIEQRRKTDSVLAKQPKESFIYSAYVQLIKPTLASLLNPLDSMERWQNLRNFVVAPITEEIVFRACFVPVLLASGMTVMHVVVLSPIFFGIAHAHHAMLRWAQGDRIVQILLATTFQFTYTSLFGMYASYIFIRTGSLAAIVSSHAVCNLMGLPDISFLHVYSPLYKYRSVLVILYITGALLFRWVFTVDYLLSLPDVLPALLLHHRNIN